MAWRANSQRTAFGIPDRTFATPSFGEKGFSILFFQCTVEQKQASEKIPQLPSPFEGRGAYPGMLRDVSEYTLAIQPLTQPQQMAGERCGLVGRAVFHYRRRGRDVMLAAGIRFRQGNEERRPDTDF